MIPLNIIIVENEFLIAFEIEQILLDAGHRVCAIASSGPEAILLAQQEKPDLAFLDVDLDGRVSGLDVARMFETIGAPHFVFMTANARALRDGYAGALGVIHKPYEPAGLALATDYLAQGIRRPPPVLARPPALLLAPETVKRWS